MNAPHVPSQSALFLADTHEVFNVGRELVDFNAYLQDSALQQAVQREGAAWAQEALTHFGALTGSAETIELGVLANQHPPELDTHDRFGRRIDLVRYHPAYHRLMKTAIEHGLHASPWSDPRPGAHVARAAHSYLQNQVEAGHGCPVTMTFAAVPALRTTPELAQVWEPKITTRVYDPRNVPDAQKAGLTIGMAMTEKQGGSDVRANSTRAFALGTEGPGAAYELMPQDDGRFKVLIDLTLTAPGCGMGEVLADEVAEKVLALPPVSQVDVQLVFDPPWDRYRLSEAARLALGM